MLHTHQHGRDKSYAFPHSLPSPQQFGEAIGTVRDKCVPFR